MKTLAVWGYEVEDGDFLLIDGDEVGKVTMLSDEGDTIHVGCTDDEGEYTEYPFGPFDTVVTIVSWDEDEDEWEDVPIEA